MRYTPENWYWLADDGRVFASARQAIVDTSDASYSAWTAAGGLASRWPADDEGVQTVAALQWVFDNAGALVFVDLTRYAASARYAKETGGLKVGTAQIDTSRESQAMIANAYQFMTVGGAASAQYKTNSGWVSVSSEQMKAIALAVGAHVQACFAAEQDLDAKIAAGAVTTPAQIDAAFAAVSA